MPENVLKIQKNSAINTWKSAKIPKLSAINTWKSAKILTSNAWKCAINNKTVCYLPLKWQKCLKLITKESVKTFRNLSHCPRNTQALTMENLRDLLKQCIQRQKIGILQTGYPTQSPPPNIKKVAEQRCINIGSNTIFVQGSALWLFIFFGLNSRSFAFTFSVLASPS